MAESKVGEKIVSSEGGEMRYNSTTHGHSIRRLLRYSVSTVLVGRPAEYPDCISLREGAEEAAKLKRDRVPLGAHGQGSITPNRFALRMLAETVRSSSAGFAHEAALRVAPLCMVK